MSVAERELARRLTLAENEVIEKCRRLGIQWTILRPTLIYGGLHGDRNVEGNRARDTALPDVPILGLRGAAPAGIGDGPCRRPAFRYWMLRLHAINPIT